MYRWILHQVFPLKLQLTFINSKVEQFVPNPSFHHSEELQNRFKIGVNGPCLQRAPYKECLAKRMKLILRDDKAAHTPTWTLVLVSVSTEGDWFCGYSELILNCNLLMWRAHYSDSVICSCSVGKPIHCKCVWGWMGGLERIFYMSM